MKRSVLFIHHAARCCSYPPNSIAGLQACLRANARAVEIDISPLADGEFIVSHARYLEESTTGSGLVASHTTGQIRDLKIVWDGSVTDQPVGFLSQAIAAVKHHPRPVELQLDLKPYAPLTDSVLRRLVESLRCVRDRVRVTSPADWALRRLHAIDPDLPLGFDPLLYLDVDSDEGNTPDVPPFRMGAYGYWDDHPLSTQRWGGSADYLAARSEALWVQSPPGAVWYIAACLLARSLDDGFDWITYLHDRGAEVTAWTLDADRSEQLALARRLVEAGVDRITTNDASTLAQALANA